MGYIVNRLGMGTHTRVHTHTHIQVGLVDQISHTIAQYGPTQIQQLDDTHTGDRKW